MLPQPQGMTKMNRAQNNHIAALSPQAQTFLCADCGGLAIFDRNDLAFGLCGHCENRLNSRENKKEKPLHRGGSEGGQGAPRSCGRSGEEENLRGLGAY